MSFSSTNQFSIGAARRKRHPDKPLWLETKARLARYLEQPGRSGLSGGAFATNQIGALAK